MKKKEYIYKDIYISTVCLKYFFFCIALPRKKKSLKKKKIKFLKRIFKNIFFIYILTLLTFF